MLRTTARRRTDGVTVELTKTEAEVITGKDEPLVISINRGGRIYLQETELEIDVLGARRRAITRNKLDTRIFVRGDRAVVYGRIMEVMGTINVAGFRHVALIAELPTDRPGR